MMGHGQRGGESIPRPTHWHLEIPREGGGMPVYDEPQPMTLELCFGFRRAGGRNNISDSEDLE